MRKLLLIRTRCSPRCRIGCESKPPVGPGVVTITETTTTTSTSTTTTTTTRRSQSRPWRDSCSRRSRPEVLQVVNFNASGSTPGTGRTIVELQLGLRRRRRMKTGVTTTHDFFPVGHLPRHPHGYRRRRRKPDLGHPRPVTVRPGSFRMRVGVRWMSARSERHRELR